MNIFHSSKVFHKKENLPAFELELMPPLLHQCVRLQYGNVLAMLGSHLDISEKSYSSLPTIFLHEYLLLNAAFTSHHETIQNAGSAIYCQTFFSWPSWVCWPSLRCWSPPPPPSTPRQKADWPKALQGQWDPVMKNCDSAANVENIKTLEIGSTPAFSRSLKRR